MNDIRNDRLNPGAIIIDGHGRADLGVARALGERRIPVYLLTDRRTSPVAGSRYVKRVFSFPSIRAAPEDLVAALQDLGRRFLHPPVFFSTGDCSLMLFSRHRAELEPFYRHHLSNADVIDHLYDKIKFASFAKKHGLPVPFTANPRSAAELEEAMPHFQFPVMVKPADKESWSQHKEIYRLIDGNLKGVRVETPEALRILFTGLIRFNVGIVVQDYIEGRDEAIWSLHAYVAKNGELLGAFTGQKLRTWPIHRGIGCFQLSIYNPDVVAVGREALKAIGYTGHAIVQMKLLPDQNRFQIFEINCRYSTWNYLHTRAGVNLPYAAYRDSLGEQNEKLPVQRQGVRWIDVANDLRALAAYRRVGEWTIWKGLKSYLGDNCYAVFDWRDPIPTFMWGGDLALRQGSAPLRRLRRGLGRPELKNG